MTQRLLLADVGNTRVKWALSTGDDLAPQQAAEHAHWSIEDWERTLFGSCGPLDGVAAVTVAGEAGRRALVEAAGRRGVREVRFYPATPVACGVTNGYPAPDLLGADRWAAVIGAHHLYRGRPCCVVDVGTAATIDAVLADGRHLGGFIVPGPRLMVSSLLRGTSDLAQRSAASAATGPSAFADNTRDAIERGCRVAVASLVDRSYAGLAQIAREAPVLALTGGAASEVAQYVHPQVEFVPDLVLHGVLRLARAGS